MQKNIGNLSSANYFQDPSGGAGGFCPRVQHASISTFRGFRPTRPSSLRADEARANLIRHIGIEPTLRLLKDAVLQHTPGAAVKTFKVFTVDWGLYRDLNPGCRNESAVS